MPRPTRSGRKASGMTEPGTRTIKVGALARVEGEGALYVRIRDREVTDVRFQIYEPPRFFEALLRGRMFTEAPDITARICGICPIAYMLGASQAMEDALGVRVVGPLRDLRRLIYCGEWIESHVLHASMLHAPDFLGMQDAFEIARAHPEIVTKALALKKLGNEIIEAVGGRAVHPVNLKVGGFYKAPSRAAIRALAEPLKGAVDAALELTRAFAAFDFPDYHHDYLFVSMRHPDEYAIHEGRIVSNRGLDIAPSAFLAHFNEEHVKHSTALHGMTAGGERYLVGPLARYSNNFHQLSDVAKDAARDAGLGPVCTNPFQSLIVRMVEVVYACQEALRLAEAYEVPDASCVEVAAGPGEGHGCTEAPRGICYHTYRLDGEGRILHATIVPPTSQNQKQIENDLLGVVQANIDLPDPDLQWRCEQTIRNYDPCISCSTHFLNLTIDRG